MARILYHKGGLVSLAANWSLSDGSAGGEPIPTSIDTAIFSTGVGTYPNFDALFHVASLEYLTSKWSNGTADIIVLGS